MVYQAASLCLRHPDADILAAAPLIRAALRESAPTAEAAFEPLFEWWERTRPEAVAAAYVDTFDMSKSHALYLSYWTDGDTRRRGMVLAGFKQRYRDSGLELGGTRPERLGQPRGEPGPAVPAAISSAACGACSALGGGGTA